MIGGAAYAGHRAGENRAYAQQQESDQEARLEALEAQQAPAAPPPAPAAAAPAGDDLVAKIKELQALKDQGILTDEEFQAAKTKVISG
jgi:hypothetical protein